MAPAALKIEALSAAINLYGGPLLPGFYRAAPQSPLRGQALYAAGCLSGVLTDYSLARRLLEQSLELAREQGDRHGMAMSLYNLGELVWYRSDPAEARRMWEECLLLDQEIGVKGGSILGGLAQLAQSEHNQRQDQDIEYRPNGINSFAMSLRLSVLRTRSTL